MPPTTEAPPRLSSRRGWISKCRWHPRLQALPLQTQRNASPFWIILLLICGEYDYRMIRNKMGIQRFGLFPANVARKRFALRLPVALHALDGLDALMAVGAAISLGHLLFI